MVVRGGALFKYYDVLVVCMARRKKWRVYQFLSSMGVVKSKKEAVELARSGKITVDGNVMESLHYQINPIKQIVAINGKRVELKENRRYFAFHKPRGIVCTKESVLEFFDVPEKASLTPVGRLDKDSSGLLIVTNDGRLVQRVLNPKTKRKKVYEVVVEGNISDDALQRLREGVWIKTVIKDEEKKYKTLPAEVKEVKPNTLHVSIIEGKKRQVRKMCEVAGCPVISLKRVAIAKLELGSIKPGEYKEYSKEQIYRLLFE